MRRILVIAIATVVALAIWAGVFLFGTSEGWWRRPLAPRGDAAGFMTAATVKIETAAPGSLAFQLIENGQPYDGRFAPFGRTDRDTRFQVASLSKWITAWGVMTLVESGRIDLDAPVDGYLKRWKLPPSRFDNRQVTVRRLLSHTAGLTDGLGYLGFEPGKAVQSLPDSLTRASDASPGSDGAARVGKAPGGGWAYSGGGYTLLQLMIEDVSGETFEAYMQHAVLVPLGMSRSTFLLPEEGGENLAGFHDVGGRPATHYRFTATAAASLYTSTADLTHFIQAHLPGPDGARPGRGVLKPETLRKMRRPHASQWGEDIWGLGVILYAPNGAGDFIVGHDGGNAPAINTSARFDPASGDGIIVLESGAKRLASELAGEWVFWRTGKVDNITFLMEMRQTLTILAGGGLLIVLAAILLGWLTRRRGQTKSAR